MAILTRAMKKQFRELIEQAQHNEADALPKIHAFLDDYPEIWQSYGDLAQHVETVWINIFTSKMLHFRESLKRKISRMRKDLAGGASPIPPLEKLLIERVIANWLKIYYFEFVIMSSPSTPGHSCRENTFLNKCLNAAEKRYLATIKSLEEYRRLRSRTKPNPRCARRKDPLREPAAL
jgi:hypothetical protein